MKKYFKVFVVTVEEVKNVSRYVINISVLVVIYYVFQADQVWYIDSGAFQYMTLNYVYFINFELINAERFVCLGDNIKYKIEG